MTSDFFTLWCHEVSNNGLGSRLHQHGCIYTSFSVATANLACSMVVYSFFFWTELRASLQQWQSLNCAVVVIVRQQYQKERSGTENKNQKQNKDLPPQQPPNTTTSRGEGETSSGSHGNLQSPALTTSSSGIVKIQCSVDNYAFEYHHRLASASFSGTVWRRSRTT